MIRGRTKVALDPFLLANLVCPRDHTDLDSAGDVLDCARQHRYRVIGDIPVMLLDDVPQTLGVADDSLRAVSDTAEALPKSANGVDAYVQQAIAATDGLLYKGLIGSLTEYPIPAMRLPRAAGPRQYLLDIGSNWGRWCIAAARLGYEPVGIDPGLASIQAAARVACQLGAKVRFVVGDARYLPFRDSVFSVAFSYSVLQHFAKPEAVRAFGEAGRVLMPGGRALIQMANLYGLRCLYQQARRRFREPAGFEVRYWTPRELKSAASHSIGPATLAVDGYFSLNPQHSDLRILPARYRMVVRASDALRAVSERVPPMLQWADSIYLSARKPPLDLNPARSDEVAEAEKIVRVRQ
jgi:SAM-dependent methyltransferase